MKTKTVTTMLAVAIAGTVVVANLFGSARTIPLPVQGDPIPGVDVSIEQSPGGVIVGTTQTDTNGVAKFTDIAPGKYLLKTSFRSTRTSNNYNSSKSNTAGLAGATIVSGSLDFSKNKPGKAIIDVSGPGQKTITLTAKEGPDPKPTPKTNPRN